MTTVAALEDNFASFDVSLSGCCNDTWNYNKLTNEVALQISQHFGVLVTLNLHLECRRCEVSILSVVVVTLIDSVDCFLELRRLKCERELTTGRNSFGNFLTMVAIASSKLIKSSMLTLRKYNPSFALFCNYSLFSNSISTTKANLPVNVGVSDLHLSDKMHENLLSLTQAHLAVVTLTKGLTLIELIHQLLVCVEDLLTVETHLRENINN